MDTVRIIKVLVELENFKNIDRLFSYVFSALALYRAVLFIFNPLFRDARYTCVNLNFSKLKMLKFSINDLARKRIALQYYVSNGLLQRQLNAGAL